MTRQGVGKGWLPLHSDPREPARRLEPADRDSTAFWPMIEQRHDGETLVVAQAVNGPTPQTHVEYLQVPGAKRTPIEGAEEALPIRDSWEGVQ